MCVIRAQNPLLVLAKNQPCTSLRDPSVRKIAGSVSPKCPQRSPKCCLPGMLSLKPRRLLWGRNWPNWHQSKGMASPLQRRSCMASLWSLKKYPSAETACSGKENSPAWNWEHLSVEGWLWVLGWRTQTWGPSTAYTWRVVQSDNAVNCLGHMVLPLLSGIPVSSHIFLLLSLAEKKKKTDK